MIQHPETRSKVESIRPAVTIAIFAIHFPVTSRRFSTCRLLILCLFLISSTAFAGSRKKTDVVYMKNGDKITCEIRSLEKGQLTVKPDYTNSNINIDWTKVDHLESTQDFIVRDPQGNLYSGTLSGKAGALTVLQPTATTLPHDLVVEIEPIGETFLKRLRGNIDFGLGFAQSNSQKNLSLQSGITYQSEKHIFSLRSSSQFTSQKETTDTNESTAQISFFRQLRESNWYGGALTNFLSSSQQQIDLQTTIGGAIAKRAIFTNRTNLNLIGGLGYTIERDATENTSSSRQHSFDAALAMQYSTFRFDSTTFDTTLWVYPGLSTPGRVRMTLNQDVYYKFLSDFYFRMSFYDNYDNQPVVGAPANNLGVTTSVGWSFH